MRRQTPGFTLWLVALAVSPLAGCQCQCTNEVHIAGDGGLVDGGLTDGGDADGGSMDAGAPRDAGLPPDGGDATVTFGPGSFTLDGGAGGVGSGVTLDPQGDVVLNQGRADLPFMWVANNDHGWVSKYDTRTGKELGRYWSVINRDCAGSMGPPCAGAQPNNLRADTVYQPSRTAIDLHGDLWVANRAIGTQGSVTKIANDPSGCIDRNGNHVIDTSRDVNGDGEISIDPADHEMITPTDFDDPTQYDECVLFTTPVGGPVPMGSVGGRALAVAAGTDPSGPGDIWVGIFHEQKLYKLDGNNGQIQRVNAAGNLSVDLAFGPYGAIVDRQQRVWAVAAGAANLAVVDTATGTVLAPNIDGNAQGCRAYAIGIDGKNRVWLPGWSAGAIACRYDLATDTWQKFDFSTAVSQTGTAFTWGRGIAVDTSGAVYMSGYATDKAQVIRFDSETGAIIPIAGAQFI